MDHSPFLALPAELRITIYTHALTFRKPLYRPLRPRPSQNSHHHEFSKRAENLSLLTTNHQISHEALKVFWQTNTFRISYNHLCTCQNLFFPYPAFASPFVRSLEIRSFLPRLEDQTGGTTCRFCKDSGLGLIDYLQHLPKLEVARIAFEDIFTFSEAVEPIVKRLSRESDVTLTSDEIGRVSLRGLGGVEIELQLPSLHRAWQCLASDKATGSQGRLPGQKVVGRALEYLHFEANTYDRTAASLKRFFVATTEEDGTAKLQFCGLLDGRQRRAEFTIALASELAKVFEDDGGADSIDWVSLAENPQSPVWSFRLDCVESFEPLRVRDELEMWQMNRHLST
ncbi:hypothetical protein B0A50_07148 [Salinomyces thailandicus]|uniref:Uncharacterized protein n=1 Tax=Salinomyces thailandicus TaxID=706561 RepID=A0A4U0TMC3_9PEZI|nr:hypothetical protein B0A50_07148 [Salinomyces thailandica]